MVSHNKIYCIIYVHICILIHILLLNNVYYYHLPFTNLLSRSNNSIKINDTKIHSQFYSNN